VIQPQRIGRYLSVDECGYVKPDIAADRVGTIWEPLVNFVRDGLMDRRAVRSVYLRGSIPRGLAIEGLSDADFIYVSETNFESDDAALERAVESRFPFVKGLELSRLDRNMLERIHRPQRRPYFQMCSRRNAFSSQERTSLGILSRSSLELKWSVTYFH
jgi:predicted nucleotidyltransferase